MPPTNVIIEVTYSKTQETVSPFKFVLHAEVTRTELISPHIFLFERPLSGPDTFCAVATPVDLTTYQASTPRAGQNFYRIDELTLKFECLADLNTVFAGLERDIQKLADNYKLLLTENLLVNPSFTKTYTGS